MERRLYGSPLNTQQNTALVLLTDINSLTRQAFITAVGYEPSSIPLAEAFYPDNADIHALGQPNIRHGLSSQYLAHYYEFFAAFPRVAEGIVAEDCNASSPSLRYL